MVTDLPGNSIASHKNVKSVSSIRFIRSESLFVPNGSFTFSLLKDEHSGSASNLNANLQDRSKLCCDILVRGLMLVAVTATSGKGAFVSVFAATVTSSEMPRNSIVPSGHRSVLSFDIISYTPFLRLGEILPFPNCSALCKLTMNECDSTGISLYTVQSFCIDATLIIDHTIN